MKRVPRYAVLTTPVAILTITGSWREARGDSRRLEDRIRQLEAAMCHASQAHGIVSNIHLFCPSILPSRRIFLTALSYNANLGGLAGADQKCQESATGAFLGGTYKAWLSDSRTHARDRLTHHPGPYRLPTGVMVALDWNDLVDGTLMNGIDVTASGSPVQAGHAVWTATKADGTFDAGFPSSTCSDWTDSSGPGGNNIGLFGFTDPNWTDASGATCDDTMRLYCIEQ